MVGFDQFSAVRTQVSLGAKDFRLFPKAFVVVVVMVNGKQIHRHYTTLNVYLILYFQKKKES